MSDLMTTAEGRNALLVAQRYLLERRMSRFFKQNCARQIDAYRNGGTFDLAAMLGDLNVANDDEILDIYRLLGAVGMLPQTQVDLTYYVDQAGTNPIPGNDTTGDGSASKPYASLWFLQNLPRRINHKVKVVFLSDYIETTLDIVIDQTFGRAADGTLGCLSFVGRGAATVISGPHEIAAIGNTDGGDLTHDTIQAVLPFGVDPRYHFIRYLDCTDPQQENVASPIIDTPPGTNDIIIVPLSANLHATVGDTFSVVDPSITFNVRSIACNQLGGTKAVDAFSNFGACVAFANLKIRVNSAGVDSADRLRIDARNPTLMSFVKFRGYLSLMTDLNTCGSNDADLETVANCGVKNINNTLGGASGARCGVSVDPVGATSYLFLTASAYMRDVYSYAPIAMQFGNPYCTDCSCKYLNVIGAQCAADYMYFNPGSNFAISVGFGFYTGVSGVVMTCADDIMWINEFGDADIFWVGKEQTWGTIGGYGIVFKGLGRVAFPKDPTKMGGTTGDIRWQTVNPNVTAAFPATYATATDGLGSYVTRRNS